MKKKLATLTAIFTLAAASTFAPAAQAQTVPVYPAPTTTTYNYNSAYVTQAAIDQVAYDLGVQDTYHRAGRGFSSGIITQTGQHVGLEFTLNGTGYATVARAYNLNNPVIAQNFQARINETALLENRLARQANFPHRTYQAPVYRASATDVIAAVGFAYIVHEALKDNHRHDHRYDNHRRYDPPRYTPPRHRNDHRDRDRNRHHRPRR